MISATTRRGLLAYRWLGHLRLRLPLSICLVGAALYATALAIANWYDWVPLSFSFEPRLGASASRPFRVDVSGHYNVEFEVSRVYSPDHLRCYLDMKDAPTDLCRSLDSHIHIEWSVYSSGNLVAEGSSTSKRAGAWGATVSRVVGTFPAEEGREYSLKVKSLSDLVPLAVADPRIAIVNRSHATKGFAVIAHVVAFIAIVVMMVGGLLLLIRLAPTGPVNDFETLVG